MKIVQLLSGLDVAISNQEKQFAEKFNQVKVDSLSEQDKWTAQNLVRKGVYSISKNNVLLKKINENT